MIASPQDLELLLGRIGRSYELLENGTLLVHLARDQAPAALVLAGPVLVAQIEIGQLPARQEQHGPLFRRLLELNADALLHASYGLSEQTLILSAALELANLDPNELEAVLADFELALSTHMPELSKLMR